MIQIFWYLVLHPLQNMLSYKRAKQGIWDLWRQGAYESGNLPTLESVDLGYSSISWISICGSGNLAAMNLTIHIVCSTSTKAHNKKPTRPLRTFAMPSRQNPKPQGARDQSCWNPCQHVCKATFSTGGSFPDTGKFQPEALVQILSNNMLSPTYVA